jgi:hypothetical protein
MTVSLISLSMKFILIDGPRRNLDDGCHLFSRRLHFLFIRIVDMLRVPLNAIRQISELIIF